MLKRFWLALAGLLILALFAAYVWPTRYRYESVPPFLVRIDRLSPEVRFLNLPDIASWGPEGWSLAVMPADPYLADHKADIEKMLREDNTRTEQSNSPPRK